MSGDQRLSVTFGGFTCDIVGYDDPIAMLNRVVTLLTDAAAADPNFGSPDAKLTDIAKARVAASLADEATKLEEIEDGGEARYVISPADEPVAEPAAETETPPQVAAPVAVEIEPAAEPVSDVAMRATTPTLAVAEAPETAEVADDIAATMETSPAPAANQPVRASAEDEGVSFISPISFESGGTLKGAIHTPPVSPDPAARRPLNLGLAPEPVEEKAETPKADATVEAEPEAAAPKRRRITVAKLPLRAPKPSADRAAAEEKAAKPEPQIEDDAPEAEEPAAHLAAASDLLSATPNPAWDDIPPMDAEPVAEPEPDHSTRPTVQPEPEPEPQTWAEPTEPAAPEVVAEPLRIPAIIARAGERRVEPPAPEPENFLFGDTEGGSEPAEAAAPQEPSTKTAKTRRSLASFLRRRRTADDIVPLDDDDEPIDPRPSSTDGFDKLRATAAAIKHGDDWDDGPSVPISQRKVEKLTDDMLGNALSPTIFAQRVGANSLQDLLEASAVYMAMVEGKSKFSRRDVMTALSQIGTEQDYPQHARLKSFRKLLTTGALVRVDDGMYTVSESIRDDYATQLRA